MVNSGRIAGSAGIGVVLGAGGTITNAGTITGGGGTAVSFGGTASDRLVIDPGAVFNGIVAGSASASNTIELASGSSTGTLSGLGTSFTNFGSVMVDSGASWDLTGSNTLAAGSTLTDDGALTNDGTLTNAGGISGGITLGSGGLLTNALGGTIGNSGTAAVYGSGGPGTATNFGSIVGTNDFGIDLTAGGAISNAAGGNISGTVIGVNLGSGGTVTNAGTITGGGDRRSPLAAPRAIAW